MMENKLDSLKIGHNVTDDKKLIEAKVLQYFGALFNGHHDSNLVDTRHPLVPDNSHLNDFLTGLGRLSLDSQTRLIKDLSFAEWDDIVMNECENIMSPGLVGLPCELYNWEII